MGHVRALPGEERDGEGMNESERIEIGRVIYIKRVNRWTKPGRFNDMFCTKAEHEMLEEIVRLRKEIENAK